MTPPSGRAERERRVIAALACVVLFGRATVHFLSTVLMQSSALALDVMTFMEGKYLAVGLMVLAFVCISVQYGLSCLHLVDLDKGEEWRLLHDFEERRVRRGAERMGNRTMGEGVVRVAP